nr:hypothetical protein [Actinomyces sp.]
MSSHTHDLDDAINLITEESRQLTHDDEIILLADITYESALAVCAAHLHSVSGTISNLTKAAVHAVFWYQDTTGAPLACALDAVRREYDRARTKHHGNTPLSHTMSDRDRSVILLEEVGEVARALTPDAHEPTGHAGDLTDELIQVATVAAAWLQHEISKKESSND